MSSLVKQGIAASDGVSVARAWVIQPNPGPESSGGPERLISLEEFRSALQQVKTEIEKIRQETARRMGESHAEIFDAHLQILEDPAIIGQVEEMAASGESCYSAYQSAVQDFVDIFERMDNAYMRERAVDLKDVSQRVLRKMTRASSEENAIDSPVMGEGWEGEVVLIADDLTPSMTATLDPTKVRGIITRVGARNSHSAILARTLGIPAVVGMRDQFPEIHTGDLVAIDGSKGAIFLKPSPETISEFQQRQEEAKKLRAHLESFRGKKSQTRDGHSVVLAANLGQIENLSLMKQGDAEGIGLFRTEFLLMGRTKAPTEDEQVDTYRRIIEACGPEHLAVIRTFDIGGDKNIEYLHLTKEENPFLGFRGIRYCLAAENGGLELFRSQLRALWRVSRYGQLGIMIPMVATMEEWTRVKEEWMRARNEVIQAYGQASVAESVQLGVMIEVPSAVWMAEELAEHVDFFSIGTNDLVQYTFAADRMNPAVAHVGSAGHPAILRQVSHVVRAAHARGKWVGMCGEAAGDMELLPEWIKLGVDELSMSPAQILKMRARLSEINYSQ